MTYRISSNRRLCGNKRASAGVLAMLLLFIMLFSAFFISAETGHDCTGEDCPICESIQHCENTLHQISGGTGPAAAGLIPAVFILIIASLFSIELLQETPVTEKVRLNN